MQRIICCAAIVIGIVLTCHAQDQRLFVSAENRTATDFFSDVSLQTGINIIYSEQVIQKMPRVSLYLKDATVAEIMDRVLQGTGIDYTFTQDQIVLFQTVN